MATKQQQFIAEIYPGAKKISEETGASLDLILAQTALETGWGQKILPGTNNIYNIKADASWHGKVAEHMVPEVDPVTRKTYMSNEKFRVYASLAESMADRTKFLAENPRYAKAGINDPGVKGNLEKEAEALAKAGYASDPHYAAKIVATAHGPTMRAGIDLAEGRTPQNQESALHEGSRGKAVKDLQSSLASLGYTDASGRALKSDGDFGPGTGHAVRTFQHDHGLRDDGVAGSDTRASIDQAVAMQRVLSMMEVGHPAKGMYDQAMQCVAQLDRDHQRETGPQSQMLSGSLVAAATAAGLDRIDHVALSDDASRVFAFQGDPKSPLRKYIDVDVMRAIQTPVAHSSTEAMTNIQVNEQARTQQGQQLDQQQTQSVQQHSAIQR